MFAVMLCSQGKFGNHNGYWYPCKQMPTQPPYPPPKPILDARDRAQDLRPRASPKTPPTVYRFLHPEPPQHPPPRSLTEAWWSPPFSTAPIRVGRSRLPPPPLPPPPPPWFRAWLAEGPKELPAPRERPKELPAPRGSIKRKLDAQEDCVILGQATWWALWLNVICARNCP